MKDAITVPRLGWSMEEGTFTGWLKADGERVRAGDPLFSMDSDKATQDVESLQDGVLQILPDGPRPGDTVRVGQVLGHLVASSAAAADRDPVRVAPSLEPTARRAVASSPRARRRAVELGVDWTTLAGSGQAGRVRERDVIAASALGRPQCAPRPVPSRAVAGSRPHSPLRLAIARRMTASHLGTAPVTLTTTVDASNLVNLRDQFRASPGKRVPTYTDFFLAIAARALREHPVFNSRWEDRGLFESPEVNVAFAVDTEAGLLAPVVRHADRLGLRELAGHTRELAERAREGRLSEAAMNGATFTLTNLGAFGVDAFTPILNPPQCAILGVGRIKKEATPVGRRFVARDVVTLSLTFDHRVADGAPAARFLQAIGRGVENPAERFID